MRQIQALLKHTEPYSDIVRIYSPCIKNSAIFRTLAHLDSEASLKTCQTCKMIRHIQGPGIISNLPKPFQGYLGIFRDIDAYSATLTGAQLEEEQVHLSCPFLTSKKFSWFWRKRPRLCPSLGWIFHSKGRFYSV